MGSTDQKRALLAILLSGVVLFSWQAYFSPNVVPAANQVDQTDQTDSRIPGPPSSVSPSPSLTQAKHQGDGAPESNEKLEEQLSTITLRNAQGHFVLLRNDLFIEDMESPNQSHPFGEVVGSGSPKIQIFENNRGFDLLFRMERMADGKSFKGVHPSTGVKIQGYLDDWGRLQFSLTSSRPYAYRLTYISKYASLGNWRNRQYIVHSKQDVDRFDVGSEEASDGSIRFSAIDYNYHLFALVFKTPLVGRYQSFSDGKMEMKLTVPTQNFSAFFIYSKKNYDHLKNLGEKLELSVDFGFFGILAVPILRGLQFFYKFFPNYGLCIILITLVIRLITFPLQFKSFKSMKKMQIIQPELKKLKEKYADDPQRMQKETMALFRKAGANPLGGCFPLILQMPIFFAFYQVLYNAVELVGAPFYFWISDLSLKDPYYVLPVLMGAAMFGQTKLNPTTGVDPTQQKIMLFLPLVFAFIMKDLPAGLNLYIFVSTLFGIAQQLFVHKTID